MNDIHIEMRDSIELNVYHCGMEQCESCHSFGPAVRDHYLIHYVLDGNGTFRTSEATYKLGASEGFLICPGQVTYYEADKDTPWVYAWVGFHGAKAQHYLRLAGLDQARPIFKTTDHETTSSLFRRMVEACALSRSREVRLRGHLYEFLSYLIEAAPATLDNGGGSRAELYVQKAVEYIQLNYSEKLTVSQIARHIGLDRSYLCSLFKQALDSSPQDFIIRFRIGKARELMEDARLTISNIARSVGYEHPLTFSKTFRRVVGTSPSEYRRLHCMRNREH